MSLVTAGAGFVGSHLCERLIGEKNQAREANSEAAERSKTPILTEHIRRHVRCLSALDHTLRHDNLQKLIPRGR